MANGMSYQEALEYASGSLEDVNVMHDPETGYYHVIRLFGVEHWSQHYTTVAEFRVVMSVKFISKGA